MGYCYDLRNRLVCDSCGDSGKTRKRTCPFKVHYPEGGSLPYCYPSALCPPCYAKHKATLHAGCKDAAAKRNAELNVEGVRLAAGELKVKAAWGDWHADVPDGFSGVYFKGATSEAYKLVPKGDYKGSGWLSDFPNALDWTGPVTGNVAKRELPLTTKRVPIDDIWAKMALSGS